jgi:hypothetical protein
MKTLPMLTGAVPLLLEENGLLGEKEEMPRGRPRRDTAPSPSLAIMLLQRRPHPGGRRHRPGATADSRLIQRRQRRGRAWSVVASLPRGSDDEGAPVRSCSIVAPG